VAKQRLGSPRARLFVALDLPGEVRDGIVAWQREALSDPALRVVGPDSLHMTLVFLGYQPEKAIDEIAAAAFEPARGAAAPRVRLRSEPVGRPKGRPRLLAIEADAEEVVAIQAGVSGSLEAAGFYKPEKRLFWPHLTVARVKPEKRGAKRAARLASPPGKLPEGAEQTFVSVRMRLYRSHLRPQGAEYESLAQLELKP
jgi:RNA 2',3'-cyclic 3'-phosphodiesterase